MKDEQQGHCGDSAEACEWKCWGKKGKDAMEHNRMTGSKPSVTLYLGSSGCVMHAGPFLTLCDTLCM